jgi:HSP20 family protein
MTMKDLLSWGRNRNAVGPSYAEETSPFLSLHREVNRLFDDVLRGVDLPIASRLGWSNAWPHVEVSETEKEVKVVAELPGMEEQDVQLTLHDGVLTIKGEKKTKSETSVYSERWHGSFQRSIELGPEVDPETVIAAFQNGVLTITLGKRPEAQSQVKRIPIKA